MTAVVDDDAEAPAKPARAKKAAAKPKKAAANEEVRSLRPPRRPARTPTSADEVGDAELEVTERRRRGPDDLDDDETADLDDR